MGEQTKMKKIVAKIKSSSSNKFYQLYKEKNKLKCPCIGFHIRQNCIHIKKYKGEIPMATKSSTRSSNSNGKLAAPKGKTTRATIISLLIKKDGHTVSMSSIKAAVIKARGFSESTAVKKIKARTGEVASWAKQHGRKLVVKSDGFKLVAA